MKGDKDKAEFVLKGALTRLALIFQFQQGPFTGPEVAEIILGFWMAYENSKESQLEAGAPALKGEGKDG